MNITWSRGVSNNVQTCRTNYSTKNMSKNKFALQPYIWVSYNTSSTSYSLFSSKGKVWYYCKVMIVRNCFVWCWFQLLWKKYDWTSGQKMSLNDETWSFQKVYSLLKFILIATVWELMLKPFTAFEPQEVKLLKSTAPFSNLACCKVNVRILKEVSLVVCIHKIIYSSWLCAFRGPQEDG